MKAEFLPNLIIPGAQKSGTTYLVELLRQHPNIFVPTVKEPAFFLSETKLNFVRHNGNPYRFAFSDPELYSRLYCDTQPSVRWRVDASTGYFAVQSIPARIAEHEIQPKIICVLRQPAHRAWSAYVFNKQMGREGSDSIWDAIANEVELQDTSYISQPYIETGLYAKHLGVWRRQFGEDNCLILFFEELLSDPQSQLDLVTSFLGIDRVQVSLDVKKNKSTNPRAGLTGAFHKVLESEVRWPLTAIILSKIPATMRYKVKERARKVLDYFSRPALAPKLSDSDFESLNKLFEKDISKLETMINCDLSHWKS